MCPVSMGLSLNSRGICVRTGPGKVTHTGSSGCGKLPELGSAALVPWNGLALTMTSLSLHDMGNHRT